MINNQYGLDEIQSRNLPISQAGALSIELQGRVYITQLSSGSQGKFLWQCSAMINNDVEIMIT